MAVNGGHVGTKKGPSWGHINFSSPGCESRNVRALDGTETSDLCIAEASGPPLRRDAFSLRFALSLRKSTAMQAAMGASLRGRCRDVVNLGGNEISVKRVQNGLLVESKRTFGKKTNNQFGLSSWRVREQAFFTLWLFVPLFEGLGPDVGTNVLVMSACLHPCFCFARSLSFFFFSLSLSLFLFCLLLSLSLSLSLTLPLFLFTSLPLYLSSSLPLYLSSSFSLYLSSSLPLCISSSLFPPLVLSILHPFLSLSLFFFFFLSLSLFLFPLLSLIFLLARSLSLHLNCFFLSFYTLSLSPLLLLSPSLLLFLSIPFIPPSVSHTPDVSQFFSMPKPNCCVSLCYWGQNDYMPKKLF